MLLLLSLLILLLLMITLNVCILFIGRNQILLSLCPQVFGMYLIKLAMAMVLAGGVQRIDSSGTKIRGISLFLSFRFSLSYLRCTLISERGER